MQLKSKLECNKCRCESNNIKENQWKKGYLWNPATYSCENGKNKRSIDDSVVVWDEIIEETKTIPTKSTSTKTVPIGSN